MNPTDDKWAGVEYWKRRLDTEAEEYPVLDGLKQQYAEIEHPRWPIARGEALRPTAANPLAALFYFIDGGLYPPPELLLALLDQYEQYRQAVGKLTLEDVFCGPSMPRVGNFSSRQAMKFRKFWITMQLDEKLRKGLTLTAAAEQVALELNDGTDADAILRANRGFKGLRVRNKQTGNNPTD